MHIEDEVFASNWIKFPCLWPNSVKLKSQEQVTHVCRNRDRAPWSVLPLFPRRCSMIKWNEADKTRDRRICSAMTSSLILFPSLCTMSARILITLAPVIQMLAPCSVLWDLFSIHIRHSIILTPTILLSTNLLIKEAVWILEFKSKVLAHYNTFHTNIVTFPSHHSIIFNWDKGGYNFFKVLLGLFYSVLCPTENIIEYAKLLPPFGCIVEFIDFLNMTGIVSLW